MKQLRMFGALTLLVGLLAFASACDVAQAGAEEDEIGSAEGTLSTAEGSVEGPIDVNAGPPPSFVRTCENPGFSGGTCYDHAWATACFRRDGSRVFNPRFDGSCCGDLANINGNITCL